MQEELRIGSRRYVTPSDGARDHRPPLAATLLHRVSDDRFDLGIVSLVEQPCPGSAFDLPTDGESSRKCLDEITLQLSGVRQRALAKRLPHPFDQRSDERCPARPASIDRGLVDPSHRHDLGHAKAGVSGARELDHRGIEHATHHFLAASPEGPLGATRRCGSAPHGQDASIAFLQIATRCCRHAQATLASLLLWQHAVAIREESRCPGTTLWPASLEACSWP